MRWLALITLLWSCERSESVVPPSPPPPVPADAAPVVRTSPLIPFARIHDGVAVLMRGPGYTALSLFSLGWFRIDRHGVHAEPETTREIARLRDAIGDLGHVVAGRTLLVAGSLEPHTRVGRPGSKALASPPGTVLDALPLGDREVWLYAKGTEGWITIVDSAGHLHPAPRPNELDAHDPCTQPRAARIAAAAHAVAALVECSDGDLRVITLDGGAGRSLQRLDSLESIGFPRIDLFYVPFVILPDGRPAIAGVRDGRLAIARGDSNGHWDVTSSAIAAKDVVTMQVDHRGDLWVGTDTIASAGVLSRDGNIVELRDPDGKPLALRFVVADPELGVVAYAYVRGGLAAWLLAESPPPGGIIDIE